MNEKTTHNNRTKEEWKAKTDRLEKARIKAEEFIAAGGDLKSKEAVPLGVEMFHAWNELATLFGHPILKPLDQEQLTPGAYLQQRIEQSLGQVAKTSNAAGYVAMWPKVVKEVLAKFPGLSSSEKASMRGNIKNQIELLAKRTGQNPQLFAPALQSVARLLG
jgi:hypothetical protein